MSARKQNSFQNKTALITGAGSGLGRALSQEFAAKGWNIAICDVNLDGAKGTQELLKDFAIKAEVYEMDVQNVEQIAQVKAQINNDLGAVDLLINNAGIGDSGTLEKVAMEDFKRLIDINLYGVVNGYQAFVGDMKKAPRAHVVNIASFAAIANPPASAAYNISKAAVVSASETMRVELSRTNVGVSVVCPAFFKTNLLDSFAERDDKVKMVAKKLMERSPTQAKDVSEAIYQAVMNDQFMVIPHKDSKMQYRVKRWLPELFHKLISKKAVHLID